MNENEKRIWDEAIEQLDDKYINEASETMKKRMTEPTELTEIIIDRTEIRKSSPFATAMKIMLASAAGLTLIFGGILLVGLTKPISTQPAATTTTEFKATVDDYITGENEQEVDFDGYSITMDYVTSEAHDQNLEKSVTLYSSVDNKITSELNISVIVQEVGEVKPEIRGYKFVGYDIIALVLPRKNEGVTYDTYIFRCTPESIEYVYAANEDIEYVPLVISSKEAGIGISYDSNSFCYYDETYHYYRLDYDIDERFTYVTPYDDVPYTSDSGVLLTSGLKFYQNEDIFYSLFGYEWEVAFNGQGSFTPTYPNIAENDEGWFLKETIGGEVSLYFIPKRDTDTMYTYNPFAEEVRKCDYYNAYKKVEKTEEVIDLNQYYEKGVTELFDNYCVTLSQSENNTAEFTLRDKSDNALLTYDTSIETDYPYNLKPKISTHKVADNNLLVFYNPKVSDGDRYYEMYFFRCTKNNIVQFREKADNGGYVATGNDYCYIKPIDGQSRIEIANYKRTRYANIDFNDMVMCDFKLTPLDNSEKALELTYEFAEKDKDREIFEKVFYGGWEGVNVQDSIIFAYYGDASFAERGDYTRNTAETKDGWIMHGMSGGAGQVHYISKDDPDTMYQYIDIGNEIPMERDYWNVFKRVESPYDGTMDTLICDVGEGLSVRGVKRFADESGYDIFATPDEVTDNNGLKWVRCTDHEEYGSGDVWLKYYDDTNITYSLLYISQDENRRIEDLEFNAEKIGGKWVITSILSEEDFYSYFSGDETINLSTLDKHNSSEIYETVFYGSWTPISTNFGGATEFSYYGDGSRHFWVKYDQVIGETENCYIMTGISGGVGVAFVVPKSNKKEMYFYEISNSTIEKSKYDCVYHRNTYSDYYNESVFYNNGKMLSDMKLTWRGTVKLAEETGYNILSTPDEVTDDSGTGWKRFGRLDYPDAAGQIYLESCEERQVVYSLLYCNTDYDISGNDLPPDEALAYLTFTAIKGQNDIWSITNVVKSEHKLS